MKNSMTVLLGLLFSMPTYAGSASPQGVYELSGTDWNESTVDLQKFGELVGGTTLVGLGEEAHMTSGFTDMKLRLIKYLVLEKNFRNLAFESSWFAALDAEKFAQSCIGDPDVAVKKLYFPDQGVRDLLVWICGFNQKNPTDKVAFYGIDEEDAYNFGPLLEKFIDDERIDLDGSIVHGLHACVGAFASHREFLQIYFDILAGRMKISPTENAQCLSSISQLKRHVRGWRRKEERFHAKLASIALTAFQNQMYAFSQGRSGYAIRDKGMADILSTRMGHPNFRGKTILWASNLHTSSRPLIRPDGTFKSVGSWMRQRIGRAYQPFLLTAHQLKQLHGGLPEFPINPNALAKLLRPTGFPFALVDFSTFSNTNYGSFSDRGIESFKPLKHFRGAFYMDYSGPMLPVH